MMFFDTAVAYQVNLQDSATYGMEMIVQLHNYVMFINVFIISVVIWFFFEIIAVTGFLQWFYYRVSFTNTGKICLSQLIFKQIRGAMLHMSTLEVVWTLLPVLALITIALPSLSMLYYFSLSFSPAVVINVIGHQWFWSYEYNYTSEQYLFDNISQSSSLSLYTDVCCSFSDKIKYTFCLSLPAVSIDASYYLQFSSILPPWQDNVQFWDPEDEFCLLDDVSEIICCAAVWSEVFADNGSFKPENFNLDGGFVGVFAPLYSSEYIDNLDAIYLSSTTANNSANSLSSSIYNSLDILDFSQRELEKFDSIMVQLEDLNYGSYRLLEVDKPLYLPVDVPIRVIVSSDDVLHSWAVPSLGVKIDCVPGRLNVVEFRIARTGVFYGQCSEICGTQHGFMPICIVAVPRKLYNFI